ncbi:MAG TPA: type II toxin-antitoxin system prevent-host-death family antitoxin [Terracidiphilus sp.]|nr:type II toxin-antitoxin system prevent-host-death family antitoxin [Terracidiphilus sp.]
MLEFGESESKSDFGRILELVEAGEEIVITRHGKPVARIAPPSGLPSTRVKAAQAAAARIRQRASLRKAGPFDWQEWKAYRDAGRK